MSLLFNQDLGTRFLPRLDYEMQKVRDRAKRIVEEQNRAAEEASQRAARSQQEGSRGRHLSLSDSFVHGVKSVLQNDAVESLGKAVGNLVVDQVTNQASRVTRPFTQPVEFAKDLAGDIAGTAVSQLPTTRWGLQRTLRDPTAPLSALFSGAKALDLISPPGTRPGTAIQQQIERTPRIGGLLSTVADTATAPATWIPAAGGVGLAAKAARVPIAGRGLAWAMSPAVDQSAPLAARLIGEEAINLGGVGGSVAAGSLIDKYAPDAPTPLKYIGAGLGGLVGGTAALRATRGAGIPRLDDSGWSHQDPLDQSIDALAETRKDHAYLNYLRNHPDMKAAPDAEEILTRYRRTPDWYLDRTTWENTQWLMKSEKNWNRAEQSLVNQIRLEARNAFPGIGEDDLNQWVKRAQYDPNEWNRYVINHYQWNNGGRMRGSSVIDSSEDPVVRELLGLDKGGLAVNQEDIAKTHTRMSMERAFAARSDDELLTRERDLQRLVDRKTSSLDNREELVDLRAELHRRGLGDYPQEYNQQLQASRETTQEWADSGYAGQSTDEMMQDTRGQLLHNYDSVSDESILKDIERLRYSLSGPQPIQSDMDKLRRLEIIARERGLQDLPGLAGREFQPKEPDQPPTNFIRSQEKPPGIFDPNRPMTPENKAAQQQYDLRRYGSLSQREEYNALKAKIQKIEEAIGTAKANEADEWTLENLNHEWEKTYNKIRAIESKVRDYQPRNIPHSRGLGVVPDQSPESDMDPVVREILGLDKEPSFGMLRLEEPLPPEDISMTPLPPGPRKFGMPGLAPDEMTDQELLKQLDEARSTLSTIQGQTQPGQVRDVDAPLGSNVVRSYDPQEGRVDKALRIEATLTREAKSRGLAFADTPPSFNRPTGKPLPPEDRKKLLTQLGELLKEQDADYPQAFYKGHPVDPDLVAESGLTPEEYVQAYRAFRSGNLPSLVGRTTRDGRNLLTVFTDYLKSLWSKRDELFRFLNQEEGQVTVPGRDEILKGIRLLEKGRDKVAGPGWTFPKDKNVQALKHLNTTAKRVWTGLDASLIGIQALPVLFTQNLRHPAQAWDEYKTIFATLGGEDGYKKWMALKAEQAINEGLPAFTDVTLSKTPPKLTKKQIKAGVEPMVGILDTPLHIAGTRQIGLDTSIEREGADIIARLSNAPGLKQTNRMFALGGDILRVDTFYNYMRNLKAQGKDITDVKLIQEAANAANRATGYSTKPFGGTIGEIALFAPRFFQSQLEMVGKAATDWGVKTSGFEGQQARRQLLAMVGLATALTVTINGLRDKDTDFIPLRKGASGEWEYNPNFLRIRDVGGTDISLLGPWDSLMRGIVTTAMDIPGVPGKGDWTYMMRSKASPLVGAAWNVISGSTMMGQDINDKETFFRNLFLPFSIREIGQQPAVATAVGFFGVKGSGLTNEEKLQNTLDKVGITTDNPDYPILRRQYLADHPEDRPLAKSATGKAIASIREDISTREATNDKQTLNDQQTLGDFRENRKKLSTERRIKLESLVKDFEGNKSSPQYKWISSYYDLYKNVPKDPVSGDIDPDSFDIAQAEWIRKNGQEAFNYIQRYNLAGQGTVETAYLKDMQTLQEAGYFDVPRYRNLTSGMSEDKLLELRQEVQSYRNAHPEAQREPFNSTAQKVLKGKNPEVISDVVKIGKEAYINPEFSALQDKYHKQLLWFTSNTRWSDYQSAGPKSASSGASPSSILRARTSSSSRKRRSSMSSR